MADSSDMPSFDEGCYIIENMMKLSEEEGCDIPSEVIEGYRLLDRSHNEGNGDASKKAIGYFVEGAFPVFDEKTTLEILKILAGYGFDEALFLCGHFLEFGTDGNSPENPDEAHHYYQKSYDLEYAPATVSLARSEMSRGNYVKALALYEEAVRKDLRERREAVISIGFIQFYGLANGIPVKESALETWTPLGTRTMEDCIHYCDSNPEKGDLMSLLRSCRVSFEIGML